MRRTFALALVLASALSRAAPNVRPVRLDYQRAEQADACPDEQTLRSAVAARLGFEPFDPEARASLHVAVRPGSNAGFDATIELTDELGAKKSRSLTGTRADCSDVREALALSLSVALEAFTSTPPPPPPPPRERTPDPVVPAPARPLTPFTALGGALALGAAPTPTGVVWLGGGFRHSLFALGLEARFQIPAGLAVESGRIDVAAASLELTPCLALAPLRVCALGAGGVTWSWATQLDGARTAVTPLVVLGARADVSFNLAWKLWLVVLGELRGALAQTALRVGTQQVWTTPPVSGVLGVALELRLPGDAVTDSRPRDK